MALSDVFGLVMIFLRAIIAVSLTRVVLRHPDMRSLRWLAALFYANAIGGIFTLQMFWSSFFYVILVLVIQITSILFIHETFYHDRRSPYKVFLTISVVVPVIGVGMVLMQRNENLANAFIIIPGMMNWIWHLAAGYQAYRAIAKEPYVEDWIKARYRLIVGYCLWLLIPAPFLLMRPFTQGGLYELFSLVIVLFIISGIVMQFFAWVMPEGFRRWLNRNYQAPEQTQAEVELTEEQIMRELRAT